MPEKYVYRYEVKYRNLSELCLAKIVLQIKSGEAEGKYMRNTQEKDEKHRYQQNIRRNRQEKRQSRDRQQSTYSSPQYRYAGNQYKYTGEQDYNRTGKHIYSNSQRQRKQRKSNRHLIGIIIIVILAAVIAAIVLSKRNIQMTGAEVVPQSFSGWQSADYTDIRPEIDVELLTPNEYSRPQTPLEQVNGIVIHYTANPGASAINNRSYFEGLKDSHETYASSHFVVGLQGEIVQCVPTNEVAYASNNRNSDTVSIEVCHPDETGEFTKETYDSLVELTGWLCLYLNVEPNQVIRHYDVTGKLCPLYYVEHEDAWENFKADVYAWAKNHEKT